MNEMSSIPPSQQRYLAGYIDVNIHEQSSLAGLFAEVCQEAYFFQKYLSQGIQDIRSLTQEELLAFVCGRLYERLLRGEIAFEWDSGKKVSSAEALALLKDPKTFRPSNPDAEGDYLVAIHIWSYDHREPFKTWMRYCVQKLFHRER